MKEEQQATQVSSSNLMDTSSVLKIRLETNDLLERIRRYLTGKIEYVIYDEDNTPKVVEKLIAKKKANDEGIHWILNNVESIINPQVVQGNLDFDQYQNYIDEVHEVLIYNIMNNLHNWEIDEDDYEPIIDNIMNLIQPFMSRLIDNKERDSYAQSIRVNESSQISQRKGVFG